MVREKLVPPGVVQVRNGWRKVVLIEHSPSEFATNARRKKCGGMEAGDAGRRNPTGRIQIRPALSQQGLPVCVNA